MTPADDEMKPEALREALVAVLDRFAYSIDTHETRADAILAELRRRNALAPGWIATADRIPDEHAHVIAKVAHDDHPVRASWFSYTVSGKRRTKWEESSEYIEAEGGWNGATLDRMNLTVTHWLPLPEPPKGEGVT